MSGVEDLLARDGERWAAARRRAAGVEDRGLGPAVRRYYAGYLPAGVVVLGAALALAALIVSLAGPVDWELVAAVGVVCAVLASGVGGFVYNRKRIAPAAAAGRVDVMLSLDDGERKSIRRQIRGKEPVAPGRLEVTRAAAVQLRRNLATQLMWMPVQVLIVLPQVIHWSGLFSGLFAAASLFVVVGLVFTYRDFRRTGVFLEQTAEQRSGRGVPRM